MNVVDAALVEADGVTTPNGRTLTALVVLAAEVRRLRAAVEASTTCARCDALRWLAAKLEELSDE